MQIEIAVVKYEMIDVSEALGRIPWCWDIVTGTWAQMHYLAEHDDVFLEVSQESVGTDNSINLNTLFLLECSELKSNPRRQDVEQFIIANKHRIVEYEKIWEFM